MSMSYIHSLHPLHFLIISIHIMGIYIIKDITVYTLDRKIVPRDNENDYSTLFTIGVLSIVIYKYQVLLYEPEVSLGLVYLSVILSTLTLLIVSITRPYRVRACISDRLFCFFVLTDLWSLLAVLYHIQSPVVLWFFFGISFFSTAALSNLSRKWIFYKDDTVTTMTYSSLTDAVLIDFTVDVIYFEYLDIPRDYHEVDLFIYLLLLCTFCTYVINIFNWQAYESSEAAVNCYVKIIHLIIFTIVLLVLFSRYDPISRDLVLGVVSYFSSSEVLDVYEIIWTFVCYFSILMLPFIQWMLLPFLGYKRSTIFYLFIFFFLNWVDSAKLLIIIYEIVIFITGC